MSLSLDDVQKLFSLIGDSADLGFIYKLAYEGQKLHKDRNIPYPADMDDYGELVNGMNTDLIIAMSEVLRGI